MVFVAIFCMEKKKRVFLSLFETKMSLLYTIHTLILISIYKINSLFF